jgi:hypothetical protein
MTETEKNDLVLEVRRRQYRRNRIPKVLEDGRPALAEVVPTGADVHLEQMDRGTSGGWESDSVESDFHLWFTLKSGRLCVRLSDQDDENTWSDDDDREAVAGSRMHSGLVGTCG